MVGGDSGAGVHGALRGVPRGESSPLAELPIQYADYAVWQRGWLRGEALEEQLAYWRGRLEGCEAAGTAGGPEAAARRHTRPGPWDFGSGRS